MTIVLPRAKIPALTQDPKNLIIYGIPKIGKTTILSHLKDCLIIDLESGSDYVDALKVKISTLPELKELCLEIKKAGCPYKFIAIDTVTSLEDFAKPFACTLIRQSPLGAKFEGNDPLKLPQGAGYGFLRDAVEEILKMVASVTTNVILVGHVKDKSLVNAAGVEIGNVKDFDLTGNIIIKKINNI